MKPRGKPDVMDNDQLRRLLGAYDLRTAEGRRGHAIVLLLYKLGVRKSELCDANMQDIEIYNQRRMIRVHRAKTTRRSATANRRRDRLVLDDEAYEALTSYRRDLDICALNVDLPCGDNSGRSGTPLFFTNAINWERYGGPRRLSSRSVDLIIKQGAARSGLAAQGLRITPHSIRATAATHMLRAGADLPTVQMFMGHSNMATTYAYLRSLPDDVHRAQAVLRGDRTTPSQARNQNRPPPGLEVVQGGRS